MPAHDSVFARITSTSLPIFRRDHGDYTLFYAPGYLAVVVPEPVAQFSSEIAPSQQGLTSVAAQLWDHAHTAQKTWTAVSSQPFTPLCLTLYLHNECNLNCIYCFADPSPRPALRLSLPAVAAAARLVLSHCKVQNRPFTFVCHGGGEPTMHQALLQKVLQTVTDLTTAQQVPLFRYIATNGVLSAQKATWLAQNFDLIGLSCDGPPDVQNRQRPLWSSRAGSDYVERTARILREWDTPFDVRVTVTPETVHRQAEIANYICRVLQPNEIHVEPVYQGGRAKSHDSITNANQFVNEFLQAEQVAQQHGISWCMSGSRPGDIHGPYCHLLRHVLHVVPGGMASACFKAGKAQTVQQAGLQIGGLDEVNGRFRLNQDHIHNLAARLHPIPRSCQNCFNQYHCARHCPDYCPLEAADDPAGTFRCRVNRQLTWARLQKTAVLLRHKARSNGGVAGQKIGADENES